MKMQHQLVPGHGSAHLVRLFSVGDLLTVEREQNAQENLQDSLSSSWRLEGLIPALADFHTYVNFMMKTLCLLLLVQFLKIKFLFCLFRKIYWKPWYFCNDSSSGRGTPSPSKKYFNNSKIFRGIEMKLSINKIYLGTFLVQNRTTLLHIRKWLIFKLG